MFYLTVVNDTKRARPDAVKSFRSADKARRAFQAETVRLMNAERPQVTLHRRPDAPDASGFQAAWPLLAEFTKTGTRFGPEWAYLFHMA